MKRPILVLAGAGVLLAVSLAAWQWPRQATVTPAAVRPDVRVAAADGATLTSIGDPVAVFQKAFWRRPDKEDIILHAERREWSTSADGLRRWQWFITCRPGPRMTDWLATNPFALPPPAKDAGSWVSPPEAPPAPEWFPADFTGYQVRKSATGSLVWLRSEDGTLLHATDSGAGFSPAGAGR